MKFQKKRKWPTIIRKEGMSYIWSHSSDGEMSKSYIREAKRRFKEKQVEAYYESKHAHRQWKIEHPPSEEETRLREEYTVALRLRHNKQDQGMFGRPSKEDVEAKRVAWSELLAKRLRDHPAPEVKYCDDTSWVKNSTQDAYDGPFQIYNREEEERKKATKEAARQQKQWEVLGKTRGAGA